MCNLTVSRLCLPLAHHVRIYRFITGYHMLTLLLLKAVLCSALQADAVEPHIIKLVFCMSRRERC